jgi:hypothetical protein
MTVISGFLDIICVPSNSVKRSFYANETTPSLKCPSGAPDLLMRAPDLLMDPPVRYRRPALDETARGGAANAKETGSAAPTHRDQ